MMSSLQDLHFKQFTSKITSRKCQTSGRVVRAHWHRRWRQWRHMRNAHVSSHVHCWDLADFATANISPLPVFITLSSETDFASRRRRLASVTQQFRSLEALHVTCHGHQVSQCCNSSNDSFRRRSTIERLPLQLSRFFILHTSGHNRLTSQGFSNHA